MKNPIANVQKKPALRVHHVIKVFNGVHSLEGTFLTFRSASNFVDSVNSSNFENEFANPLNYYVKTVNTGHTREMSLFIKNTRK